MQIDLPHPGGLKPTLRQMMILVLWAGLVSAFLRFESWLGIFQGQPEIITLSLLSTFPALPIMLSIILLFLFDQRGPVRSWYIQSVQAWGGLIGATVWLFADLISYALTGRPTMLFPMFLLFGIGCFWTSRKHLQSIRPSVCQACGSRTLIRAGLKRPVPGPWFAKTRGWCATCGQVHEKQGTLPWCLEDPLN